MINLMSQKMRPPTKSEHTQTDTRPQMASFDPSYPSYDYASMMHDQAFPQTRQFSQVVSSEIDKIASGVEDQIRRGKKARDIAFFELEKIVSQVLGDDVYLNIFGSQATGIAHDASDLDIAVRGMNFYGNKDTLLFRMEELHNEIKM